MQIDGVVQRSADRLRKEHRAADPGHGQTADTLIAAYHYDGRNYRIAKLLPNGENWDRTDYYYNDGAQPPSAVAWQVLEERFAADVPSPAGGGQGEGATSADPVTAVHVQWLWDVRYIDAPVLRWRDADSDPQTGLEEVLYYANDANMNVTALVDATPGSQTIGQVVERYVYDPYGRATVYNGDWSAEVAWANSRKNEVTYCGYRFDPESQLHHVRWRYYLTTTGAWASRDPAGYVRGLSLSAYCRSSPVGRLDPTGLFNPEWYEGTNQVPFPMQPRYTGDPEDPRTTEVLKWHGPAPSLQPGEEMPLPSQVFLAHRSRETRDWADGERMDKKELPVAGNDEKGVVFCRPRWAWPRRYPHPDETASRWTTSSYPGILVITRDRIYKDATVDTFEYVRVTARQSNLAIVLNMAQQINYAVDVGLGPFSEPVTDVTDAVFFFLTFIPEAALVDLQTEWLGGGRTYRLAGSGSETFVNPRVVDWTPMQNGKWISRRRLPTGVCMSLKAAQSWCEKFNGVIRKHLDEKVASGEITVDNAAQYELPEHVFQDAVRTAGGGEQ